MINKSSEAEETKSGKEGMENQSHDMLSPEEVLQYLKTHDTVSYTALCEKVEMEKDKKYLDMHPYDIWKGADGQYHTYLPGDDGGRRLHRHRKTREELEKVVIDYWKPQVENPTFKEVFEEYEQRCLDFKEISLASYDRHMRTYLTHCKEFGERRIKDISPNEIEDFLKGQIAEHNLTSKAFCSLKTLVKWTFKRAHKRGLIDFSPEQAFADMDFSKNAFRQVVKEDYEEVFSENETALIVSYLIDHPDALNYGLLLALVTGIRVGELATLKHLDFDEDAVISIRRTETKYHDEEGQLVYAIKDFAKTRAGVRKVVIPIDFDWLAVDLQKFNPESEFIFADKDGTWLISDRFRKRLSLICKTLGIYNKSPHKLRKTYCTILLDNNLDKRLVTDQMGHTDINCSEQRYHRNRRSLDAKREIISNISEFQLPKDSDMTS